MDHDRDDPHGDVPAGVGPDVFRRHLEQAAAGHDDHGGHITLDQERVFLEDIEAVEADSEPGRSRVRLRNGVIIGGLTGAAIVAALATIRYRRHRGS